MMRRKRMISVDGCMGSSCLQPYSPEQGVPRPGAGYRRLRRDRRRDISEIDDALEQLPPTPDLPKVRVGYPLLRVFVRLRVCGPRRRGLARRSPLLLRLARHMAATLSRKSQPPRRLSTQARPDCGPQQRGDDRSRHRARRRQTCRQVAPSRPMVLRSPPCVKVAASPRSWPAGSQSG